MNARQRALTQTTGEWCMETSDTYKQLMVAWLKLWNTEINALDVKAENATTEAKLKYVVELDVLHTKKRAATKTLKELEAASGPGVILELV